ncbi:MAG: transposase, partial [Alphaproteobacteria bacterium]|nr:transposase [Alphaproteobacteria bacterium]
MAGNGKINSHYLIEKHGNLPCVHWRDGPYCPHCGEREAIRTIQDQTTRPGIYHCLTCRKRFAGTLDILFQETKPTASGHQPAAWLWAGRYNGPRSGLLGRAAYGTWYLAGVMRSLHRYASDGMVAMMMLH